MSNSESPFFRLPPEIRRMIYDLVIDAPETVKLADVTNVTLNHDRHLGSYMDRPVPRPCPNSFVLTCRQAYQETRHIFYQTARFATETPISLEAFMQDTQAQNLVLIQEIDVNYLWTAFFPDLSALRGLKILTTCFLERGFDAARNGQHPRKAFLRGFLWRARQLPSLKIINMSVCGDERNYREYKRYPLDLEDIPGWVYAVRRKPDRVLPNQMLTLERLRRVHGPHWLEMEWGLLPKAEPTGDEGVL